jgi:hypothetical protein
VRRLLAVVSVMALAGALSRPVALAAFGAAASYDFRTAVLLRLFGETSDPAESLAASYGDRASESPLRSLALGVSPKPRPFGFSADLAAVPTFAQPARRQPDGDGYGDLAASAGGRLAQSAALLAPSTRAFPVAAYQPVAQAPGIRLESGDVAFVPLAAPEPSSLSQASASTVAGAAGAKESVPAAVDVGKVRFQGRLESDSAQAPQIALRDSSYGAGANFGVRAGARRLDVDLSSSYEQLTRNDATFSASSPTASLQLPGTSAPLIIPNYGNMSRLTLGAGVAVPLVNGLTLNLNYDAARLLGSYGLPGLTNLDAIDNAYGGGLTFALPHSSSTLSLSAYQYRYQDNIVPANSTSQTRENLNFTVKF